MCAINDASDNAWTPSAGTGQPTVAGQPAVFAIAAPREALI